MARIRTIKPEFPQSESMGRVSRDARLLFIELWTICDDEGRTRAASRMLASLLFPYDDDAPKLIDEWLSELERERCVIRYEVDGSTYLQVCNWLNHQKIDKPSKSKILPFDESSRILANPRERSSEDQGSRIRDQGEDQTPCASADAERDQEYPERFMKFWDAYPRKKAKGDALKAWKKLKPSERLAGEILQAVLRAKTSADWAKDGGQFIPYPASWLNSRGWEDEMDAPVSAPAGGPDRPWHETASGIEAKGAELGITLRPSEIFPSYKARVFAAARSRGMEVPA